VETASDCHVADEAVHMGRGMQRSGHDNLRWKGCRSREGWGVEEEQGGVEVR
jgi:hypothetical protein